MCSQTINRIFFIIFLCAHSAGFAHKIIYLISPPRSLSVAFLRMMQARDDFQIIHEPSIHPHALLYYPELTQEWFSGNTFKTFDNVTQEILKAAHESNVFIKDMSWGTKKVLEINSELLGNPDIYFVFLVRNPHHSIISFYKKIPIYQDSFSFLIGYKSLYEVYKLLEGKTVHKPLIIYSEDLYQNPEKTIAKFCDTVGILFEPDSLSWNNMGNNFTGKEWCEDKSPSEIYHWHGEAIKSSGFTQPTSYKEDSNGNPTFEEIIDPEHRIMCIKAYEENMVYYNLIKKEK